jgi:phytanoyl-CoA hydroxylase
MKENGVGETGGLRAAFENDGFVAVPGFLADAPLAECLANLDRYIADRLPSLPREHAFYENRGDPASLKQLQQMHRHDAWFRDLIHGAPMRLAETLLGTPVTAQNLQYFNKPPRIGNPTPPHQDGYYFKLEPPEALTMWLALEPVDEETGCVRYVRGSHRNGMRTHGLTGTLGFSQGMTDFGRGDDLANEVAMPAGPGDLLAHHAMTIHRADGNRSATRTRRALGFIYYSVEAHEDEEAKAAYQAAVAAQQRGKL